MQQISFQALGTSWWINIHNQLNIKKTQEIEDLTQENNEMS